MGLDRFAFILFLLVPAWSMRQASNGTACDSFLPFGRKCCEAKCDGKRGDYDRGSNVEDLELYECIPTYGAFKKPKRTYGVYEADDTPITSKEMNDYITAYRHHRTLSQLPESDYVCEETCRFLYKGEQKDPLNYKTLKVYRSGGVEVKDDTALCVSKNKMQKPKPRSLKPYKIEVSTKDKVKAKLAAAKSKIFGS